MMARECGAVLVSAMMKWLRPRLSQIKLLCTNQDLRKQI
jgi:hypothetical protein